MARFTCSLVLAALASIASGCDEDTPVVPYSGPTLDGGQLGQGPGSDAGSSDTDASAQPGPGSIALGLSLPNFYAFVNAPQAIANSGLGFMLIASGPGEPVAGLDQAIFELELNGSAQGRKAGAIPVFVRVANRPSPNVGFQAQKSFVCAQVRSGSSGRTYRTLQNVGEDPATNAPYPAQLESCSWFLVEVETAGKKRYKPMIFVDGVEAYLAPTESDPATGRHAHFGATFSQAASFQLLSSEHTGPVP